MNKIRLFALGAMLAFGTVSAAAAKSVTIIDVETGNPDLGNVSVAGFGTPWTTPILMTDSQAQTFVVFCDDLNHVVNVGGGQSLPYHFGEVKVDGAGNPISENISNEMGQLAQLGVFDYAHHDEDGAIAAQAAIWGLEYGIGVSSSDSSIQADILTDLAIKPNGAGWAYGLLADGGTQSQLIGLTGGVPEPAEWALMLAGVFSIGAVLRRAQGQSDLAPI